MSGNFFDEHRGNGTLLQFKDTQSGSLAAGGRIRTGENDFRFNVFGDWQEFRSTFSTQSIDRNSETLALDQTVPSTSLGGSLQWSCRFGPHVLLAGGRG